MATERSVPGDMPEERWIEELQYYFDGSNWHGFLNGITWDNRFHPDWRLLLDYIKDVALRSVRNLPAASTVLYRSRMLRPPDPSGRTRRFSPAEMWAPPATAGAEGRLNPLGIPYLYLSSDPATAVAEQRPWRDAAIAVGAFRATRDIRVFDFATFTGPEPIDSVRGRLNDAFSAPVHEGNAVRYVATQYIAEYLKSVAANGVVGLLYSSSMRNGGENVALFGGAGFAFMDLLDCEEVAVYVVKSVAIDSEPAKHQDWYKIEEGAI